MLKNGFLTQKIPSPCFSNHRSGGENLGCNPVDDELFVTFFFKKKVMCENRQIAVSY
jgi:hypothetical protein